MLDLINRALQGVAEPVRAPVPRVPLAEMAEKPQPMAGYLDATPGSTRPPLGLSPALRTADEEIRAAWQPVAAHARHMLSQSGFLAYGVELSCAWTVGGDGLGINVVPDAEALGWKPEFAAAWARFAEARFREWSNDPRSCDSAGRMRFGALQNAALRSYFATGDVLASLDFGQKQHTPWKTSISLIDPARLATPLGYHQGVTAVRDGVEFDRRGRAVAYHFRQLPGFTGGQTIRVPAITQSGRQIVLHAFDGDVGTVRGISPLAPAMASIMQSQNVGDAATMAAHLAALICGVVTSDLPSADLARAISDGGSPLLAMQQARAEWHGQLHDARANLTLPHGGKIVHLLSGERLEILAGKAEFDQYEFLIKNGLREAARAIGLSYEQLTGDKSEATYSSTKIAIAEAFSIVERRRRILVEPLVEWAFHALVEEMIDAGMLDWPGVNQRIALEDYRLHRHLIRLDYRGPAAPSPDEFKAARAASIRVQMGLSSYSQEVAAMGSDFEAVVRQREADEALMAKHNIRVPFPDNPSTRGAR